MDPQHNYVSGFQMKKREPMKIFYSTDRDDALNFSNPVSGGAFAMAFGEAHKLIFDTEDNLWHIILKQ